MRSGETRRDVTRRPGLWTTWGQALDIPAGAQPTAELVRAALGRPVVWVVQAWLTGGAVGDVVLLRIACGLGANFGVADFPFPKVGAADFFFQPGIGFSATELIVSVTLTAPAIAPLRILVQTAPLVWPPDVDPVALEPALR